MGMFCRGKDAEVFIVEVEFARVGVLSGSRRFLVSKWLESAVADALVRANAVVESTLGHPNVATL